MTELAYRQGNKIACENCTRHRVLADGVCEKCNWDNDVHRYSERPEPTHPTDCTCIDCYFTSRAGRVCDTPGKERSK